MYLHSNKKKMIFFVVVSNTFKTCEGLYHTNITRCLLCMIRIMIIVTRYQKSFEQIKLWQYNIKSVETAYRMSWNSSESVRTFQRVWCVLNADRQFLYQRKRKLQAKIWNLIRFMYKHYVIVRKQTLTNVSVAHGPDFWFCKFSTRKKCQFRIYMYLESNKKKIICSYLYPTHLNHSKDYRFSICMIRIRIILTKYQNVFTKNYFLYI